VTEETLRLSVDDLRTTKLILTLGAAAFTAAPFVLSLAPLELPTLFLGILYLGAALCLSATLRLKRTIAQLSGA